MNEKRKHDRLPLTAEVEVRGPGFGPLAVQTADFSEGGLFLRMPGQQPPVGTELTLQLRTPLGDGEAPPLIQARVVRRTEEGVGVMFIDGAAR